MTAPVFLLAVVAVLLNASAQLALRRLMLGAGMPPTGAGTAALGTWAVALAASPWFVVGMACYALSLGLWLLVLARAEVSLAYPLLSIGYLVTAAAGYFLLHEAVGPTRLAGLALICAGIVVVSRS